MNSFEESDTFNEMVASRLNEVAALAELEQMRLDLRARFAASVAFGEEEIEEPEEE